MADKTCKITRCELPAHWTVTFIGHPNHGPGPHPADYCTEHAREKAGLLWEASPKQYRVTVDGPW